MKHVGYRPEETAKERAARLRNAALAIGAIIAAVAVGRYWQGKPEWVGIAYVVVMLTGIVALWNLLMERKFGCRKCSTFVGTERTGLPAACPTCGTSDYMTDGMGVKLPDFASRERLAPAASVSARTPKHHGLEHTSGVDNNARNSAAAAAMTPARPAVRSGVHVGPDAVPTYREPFRSRALGWLCIGLVWLLYLGAAVAVTWVGYWRYDLHPNAMRVLLPIAGAVVLAVAFPLHVLGRKLLAPSLRQLLQRDPRAPVLYLRSFQADSEQLLRRWWQVVRTNADPDHVKSEEEELVETLGGIGPVVAIGRPGERLPTSGAGRLYPGAAWRAAVHQLAGEAALTVLRVGDTQGVQWEVEQVLRRMDPKRIVLWAPAGSAHERYRIYEQFRARTAVVLPHPLPEYDPATPFLRFDSHWRPVRLESLEPVLEAYGVMPSATELAAREADRQRAKAAAKARRPRGWRRAAQLAATAGIMLLLALLAMTLTSILVQVLPGNAAWHDEIGWPGMASLALAIAACVFAYRRVLPRVPLRRWWLLIFAPLVGLLALTAWIESLL